MQENTTYLQEVAEEQYGVDTGSCNYSIGLRGKKLAALVSQVVVFTYVIRA
jgi:hypothetical protein